MGLYLIAQADTSLLATIGSYAWIIGSVGLALGFVIFVHELGHFLVAKACGVKCEKFYVGFDVPMPKILGFQIPSNFGRFQWGETEYGIGIIPLGGYVKMLGQDDDPRNAQQEMERIRVKKDEGGATSDDGEGANAAAADKNEAEQPTSQQADTASSADDDEYELDPRSFPAKTVPQRMAIISAGVIVNLIFAVIFAAVAFRMGVTYTTCDIGTISPGSPAWFIGMEPGSKIIQLGENGKRSERLRFIWDLSNAGVGLSGTTEDLYLVARNADGEEKSYTIRPKEVHRLGGARPMLGVGPRDTLEITAAIETMAAGKTDVPLKSGDLVLSVDGSSVQSAAEVHRAFLERRAEPIRLTVQRQEEDEGPVETLDATIQPQPLKRVGLVMDSSPIVGLRPGSPAEQAGVRKGDVLLSIAGEPVTDPMLVPAQLVPHYGQDVEIRVRRDDVSVTLQIRPQVPQAYDWQLNSGLPMGVDAIGIAYDVHLTVKDVLPNSPAAAAGIEPGDTLTGVQFVSDDPEGTNMRKPVELSEDGYDWLIVFELLQGLEPEAKLKLNYRRDPGGEEQLVTLVPQATEVFAPHRGLLFENTEDVYVAETWGEALSLGFERTKHDAFHVTRVLKKLATGGISVMNLGGPMTIAVVAASETSQGLSRLLIFLTFLSANLAVLNFLPIPALDGGHMVFLIAEGILRRPIDERLQGALTLAGVCCLLTLMVFVFGLDIHRLFFR